MEEGKKIKRQTALGNSGQSVREDRAAAPSVWQVLLFAEASCEHVELHWPVSPAAFPPLQPRGLLGVCTAKPCPGFFSLSSNCVTFRASLMSSGNLWCASGIYLRKEMHPEQFIDGLFCLPTCSCFEETSCSGSRALVPWWALSEAV